MWTRKIWPALAVYCGMNLTAAMAAQDPLRAADWKTWVIRSGAEHWVPAPPGDAETQEELNWLRAVVAHGETEPRVAAQIRYWDAGPASYRWMEMVASRQSAGQPVGTYFVRAHTYVALAIHDATVAALYAQRQYGRARPAGMETRLPMAAARPSYPSEHAAVAAAAAEVMAYLVPAEAAMFRTMAEEAGKSRLFAGVAYPSDYVAGMELGRRVAAEVIARARMDGADMPGSVTAPPACDSADVQAQLAAVRSYPRGLTGANMNTNARAFYWQTPEGVFPWALMQLNRWVLEDQLENDPGRAARAYALLGAVGFDAFIASQDAKFTYWYPRPAQLDPSLTPLFPAPNFPSYPSNHSTFSTARAEVLAYLFPERAEAIRAMGKEAGDSRIWAGIHFEMDNQAGAAMGRAIAHKFIARDGEEGLR